ncbi:hypothetical protein [Haladaptatus sp. CMAA 1911]|uniref:hypothetical protein n=1 Tax=unclassified Haladaptatus TaxID=2622732 RepID=UPI003754E2DD
MTRNAPPLPTLGNESTASDDDRKTRVAPPGDSSVRTTLTNRRGVLTSRHPAIADANTGARTEVSVRGSN